MKVSKWNPLFRVWIWVNCCNLQKSTMPVPGKTLRIRILKVEIQRSSRCWSPLSSTVMPIFAGLSTGWMDSCRNIPIIWSWVCLVTQSQHQMAPPKSLRGVSFSDPVVACWLFCHWMLGSLGQQRSEDRKIQDWGARSGMPKPKVAGACPWDWDRMDKQVLQTWQVRLQLKYVEMPGSGNDKPSFSYNVPSAESPTW